MKSLISCFFIVILVLTVSSCSREKNKQQMQTMIIQEKSLANTLFYAGTIQPLSTLVIPSPVDGIVMDMSFQYGEMVKKGQLLFQISSAKFMGDYKTALMQYIKAKSDFNTAQSQLSEADFLHKNQLISDDDFKMKESNFYAAR